MWPLLAIGAGLALLLTLKKEESAASASGPALDNTTPVTLQIVTDSLEIDSDAVASLLSGNQFSVLSAPEPFSPAVDGMHWTARVMWTGGPMTLAGPFNGFRVESFRRG